MQAIYSQYTGRQTYLLSRSECLNNFRVDEKTFWAKTVVAAAKFVVPSSSISLDLIVAALKLRF